MIVAKRLVRFTKIRFVFVLFDFPKQKIDFFFVYSMVGYLVWHISFSFNSNLTIFSQMHWEKFADWFWALLLYFFFYSNDSEFLFFSWSFQHLATVSVGLIGFWRLIDRFLFFNTSRANRLWRTDIYGSNLQLTIETFKVDIKKLRGVAGLLECLLFSVSVSNIFIYFFSARSSLPVR